MCAFCHVVAVELEVTDLAALKAACARLGWAFKENCRTHRWYGRWVDDSPVPRHLFASGADYERVCAWPRAQRQEFMTKLLSSPSHVIAAPGFRYEVGVYQVQGGFRLAKDTWRECQAFDPGPLLQAYAVEKTKHEAHTRGFSCTETPLQDGTIRLRIGIGDW